MSKAAFRRILSIVLSVMLIFSTSGVTECLAENVSREEIPAEETVTGEEIKNGEEAGADGETVISDEKPESDGDTVSSDESGEKTEDDSPDGSGPEQDSLSDNTVSGDNVLSENNISANTVSADDTKSVSGDIVVPIAEGGREPEILGAKPVGARAYHAIFPIIPAATNKYVVYDFFTNASGKYDLYIRESNDVTGNVTNWDIANVEKVFDHTGGNNIQKDNNYLTTLLKNTTAIVGFSDKIKAIPDNTFKNMTSLLSVKFEGEGTGAPCNVSSIGESAFEGCTSLKYVTGESSVYSIYKRAFYNCENLKNIYLPEYTCFIGDYAFYNCKNLKGICFRNQNDSLEIGDSAFEQCYKMEYISLPDEVDYIGNKSFYYTASNYSTFQIFAPNGFKYNTNKTIISFCDDINSIGKLASGKDNRVTGKYRKGYIGADEDGPVYEIANNGTVSIFGSGNMMMLDDTHFSWYPWRADSINKVVLSMDSGSVAPFAFRGMASITEVDASANKANIGGYAFYECSGLNKLNLGANNYELEDCAFYGCAITELTYGGQTLGADVFEGANNTFTTLNLDLGTGDLTPELFKSLYRTIDNPYAPGLKTLNVISVGNIKSNACSQYTDLKNLNISKANTIERNAFKECGIDNPVIGNVSSIQINAFSSCSSLKTFNTGGAVTMSYGAIINCYNLNKVIIGPALASSPGGLARNTNGDFSVSSLVVDNGNTRFKSDSAKKYIVDKATGKTLIWAANTVSAVPAGITAVGSYAFFGSITNFM